MVFFRKAFSFLLALFLLIIVLFVDFTYKTFSQHQQDLNCDAIVVLAGGRGRIEEGSRLYRENRAPWLFLIGVDPSVRKSDLFTELKGGRSGDGVYLEKVSRNTLENALYAKEIIMRHNVRSVNLITSRYHMKRAALIFRHVLPKEVVIYSHPVDTKNLKEEWWNHSGSFRLLFSEFYKYYLFRIFFFLAPTELQPSIK